MQTRTKAETPIKSSRRKSSPARNPSTAKKRRSPAATTADSSDSSAAFAVVVQERAPSPKRSVTPRQRVKRRSSPVSMAATGTSTGTSAAAGGRNAVISRTNSTPFAEVHGIVKTLAKLEGESSGSEESSSGFPRDEEIGLYNAKESCSARRSRSDSKAKKRDAKEGPSDIWNIALLVGLYLLQGIPLGLAMGSVPYLLKKKLSYAEMATFSLASYPYSLKLLWSPIVDSLYFAKVGRRRSWIIPTQLCIAAFMMYLGMHVDTWLEQETINVNYLTGTFVSLVFLSATQDIAVDGWALTLLSEENITYASTSQTIGLNTGYFLSFTVFLALNSASFCNSYLRTIPQERGILMLGPYLQFWAVCCLFLTICLVLFKTEGQEKEKVLDIKSAYQNIWKIMKLQNMKTFIVVLLIAKLGFVTNDAVTGFKLMEKGLKEEDLALTVLINFPLQLIFGYLAARWSNEPRRLRPWTLAFYGRLAMVIISMVVVASAPTDGITSSYFALVILCSVLGSFLSTVQFVSMGAFFATIADPTIGGTYMTLLNTVSNFGGTYPQYFVLRAVDIFTSAQCQLRNGKTQDCSTKEAQAACSSAGGICNIETDGYYIVSIAMISVAILTAWLFIMPQVSILERLSPKRWRIPKK